MATVGGPGVALVVGRYRGATAAGSCKNTCRYDGNGPERPREGQRLASAKSKSDGKVKGLIV
jgi:hypothetical protein